MDIIPKPSTYDILGKNVPRKNIPKYEDKNEDGNEDEDENSIRRLGVRRERTASTDSWDEKEAEKEAEKVGDEADTSIRQQLQFHSSSSVSPDYLDPLYDSTFPLSSSSSSSSSFSQSNPSLLPMSHSYAPIAKKVLQAVWTENLEFQTDRSLFNRYVEVDKEVERCRCKDRGRGR